MFDIGFSELLIIAVLTLIVMGPERLPETVRTITLWLGRLRQFLSAARTEIEDEVGVDEIRRQLHNEQDHARPRENQRPVKRSSQRSKVDLS